MSSNLVPSFRFPGIIADPSVPKAVSDVMRLHANALTDIYQAIPALKSQIAALQAGTGSTTIINSGGTSGGGGGGSSFPGLGSVNDLQGDASYTNQPSDNGALLIFGDSSPVAVQLSSGVPSPYFFFAQNWDSGAVTFTPSSGTISYIGNPGAASMTMVEGNSAIVVFDGANWWAELASSGLTQLTGDVLAGPGSGSQAATLNTGVVGWDVPAGAGLVASPAGNIQAAVRAYPITECIVTVTASDATTDLTFDILQNGVSIFTAPQTVDHGTALGTVLTLALRSASLPVAKLDKFAMNITAGTATWAFTVAVR